MSQSEPDAQWHVWVEDVVYKLGRIFFTRNTASRTGVCLRLHVRYETGTIVFRDRGQFAPRGFGTLRHDRVVWINPPTVDLTQFYQIARESRRTRNGVALLDYVRDVLAEPIPVLSQLMDREPVLPDVRTAERVE